MGTSDSTKRKYDADETRARLVVAAQQAFTKAKYEDVSVRDIASAASANVALVNRYFGGKQGLFEASFADFPGDSPFEAVPITQWPAMLADMMVGKVGSDVRFDPLLALLRSAQSPMVGAYVRDLIQHRLLLRLEPLLPKDGHESVRSRVLLAFILGVDVTERMVNLPFDSCKLSELKDAYQRAIASILLT